MNYPAIVNVLDGLEYRADEIGGIAAGIGIGRQGDDVEEKKTHGSE